MKKYEYLFFDLDGTLVEHNGYKSGKDKLLPGVREFWSQIPETDYILILTARENAAHDKTVEFLNQNHILYQFLNNGFICHAILLDIIRRK